jgi:UDP-glucose 4-epimerase
MFKKALVTGGAGFIGSHLTERLLKEGYEVVIIDNFRNGKLENINHLLENPKLNVVEDDLKTPNRLHGAIHNCETIFHFAANPEVKVGETDPKIHFTENLLGTFNLLEAAKEEETVKNFIFASTSTVYGEAEKLPTPENYGPLIPISTYGASKLGCEALITSYAHTFDFRALLLRFANIIGPRSTHGVIIDFINKIRNNQTALEILGDGTQTKSYLYIADCINAIIHATKNFLRNTKRVEIYNIGSEDQIAVKKIAKIVATKMNVPRIELRFTGGVDGGRGWKGDVKTMNLSTEKLQKTGWKAKYKSEKAVELATQEFLRGIQTRR